MSSESSNDKKVEEVTEDLAKANLGEKDGAEAPKAPQLTPEQIRLLQAQRAAQMEKMLLGARPSTASQGHKFWDTQPVPKKEDEEPLPLGPLDAEKTVEDVPQNPYPLPPGFEWCVLDVAQESVILEAYDLLTNNYVEDDDNMFRFDYSPAFLRWALMPPGYVPEWHVGLRNSKNNKLLAMITGIPAHTHVGDEVVKMAEINFLCIHKKLRSKRLAPVLIKEVTRRVNLKDQWQAVYTAGVHLPRPITIARYWHRSLNPKKLISVGFSRLGDRMTMARTIRLYKVPDEPQIAGIRPMEKKDVKGVQKLLTEYLKQYKVWIEFNEEEIGHWLLPREDVVYAYVVEDPNEPGKITDVCSFYNLPSTILGNDQYNHLKAAYSFYNVATTVPLKDLMNDALIFAYANQFDVFNALDIMENASILKELKFGIGDGNLHYYLYNYYIPQMAPKDCGIVLL